MPVCLVLPALSCLPCPVCLFLADSVIRVWTVQTTLERYASACQLTAISVGIALRHKTLAWLEAAGRVADQGEGKLRPAPRHRIINGRLRHGIAGIPNEIIQFH